METKIDLNKMNEQDWKKYSKMHKVAERRKITGRFLATLILAFVVAIGIVVGLIIAFSSAAGNTGILANYASNQTITIMHNLNISFNSTNYIHWTNAMLSNLISTMKNNPKALSTFAVNTYATMQSYFFLFTFLYTLIIIIIFFLMLFGDSSELHIPKYYYKSLKMRLTRLAERDENLKVYGYTGQEIAWYHAVRAELIKLELEYSL